MLSFFKKSILNIGFFNNSKNLCSDEMMYLLLQKNDKKVKHLKKAKQLQKMSREEEMIDEIMILLLDICNDLHFHTNEILIGYSVEKELKTDIIETHNYIANIVHKKDKLRMSELKTLKEINSDLYNNLHHFHHMFFHAKLVHLNSIINSYKKEEEKIFDNALIEYQFIDNFFISLCNHLSFFDKLAESDKEI